MSIKKLQVKRLIIPVILIISWVGTLGSLYYGYFGDIVANIASGDLFNTELALVPCDLCWYQRALLYGTTVVATIGVISKDKKFIKYVLAFSFIGIGIAAYHYYIQRLNASPFLPCVSDKPCTEIQVNYFGFITIPLMSLAAFLINGAAAATHYFLKRRDAGN